MEKYVLPLLKTCDTATATFDLWMSRRGVDTFSLVVNFLSKDLVPHHVTVGVFEVSETGAVALAKLIRSLLNQYKLTNKIIAYAKDEGSNFIKMASTLEDIVTCDPLNLANPYVETCFGHYMSKAYQYAINDKKNCSTFSQVPLKSVQVTLQRTITWTKNWEKDVKNGSMHVKLCIYLQESYKLR
jgi:hypothetical protein